MKLNQIFIFNLFILTFVGCRKDSYAPVQIPPTYDYAFMVAGHTYGNPINYQYGLHPAFVNQFDFFNQYPGLKFGFFTGDVVPDTTIAYWNSAKFDINQLNFPIHIAAGNHDRSQLFDSLFTPYYKFTHQNDLFIILNTTNWNIIGDQKVFLESTINEFSPKVRNIFIFTHELIWWNKTNEFSNIKINYLPNFPGSTNYWSDIFPMLDTLNNNVYLFAGDLGATEVVTPYVYHKSNNITYLGSGMGNNSKDNVIVAEVDSSGGVHFKLLGLNNTVPYEIENIEEFILP